MTGAKSEKPAKVTVTMLGASRGIEAGAKVSVDAETAEQLKADGLAR